MNGASAAISPFSSIREYEDLIPGKGDLYAFAEVLERLARIGIDRKPVKIRPDQCVERFRQLAVLELPSLQGQDQRAARRRVSIAA